MKEFHLTNARRRDPTYASKMIVNNHLTNICRIRTGIPKRVNWESSKTTNTRSMRHSIASSLEGKVEEPSCTVYSSEYNANNGGKTKSQWIHVIVYGIKGAYFPILMFFLLCRQGKKVRTIGSSMFRSTSCDWVCCRSVSLDSDTSYEESWQGTKRMWWWLWVVDPINRSWFYVRIYEECQNQWQSSACNLMGHQRLTPHDRSHVILLVSKALVSFPFSSLLVFSASTGI